MTTPIDASAIFAADVDPQVALRICDRYARSVIALHDDTGAVPEDDQEILATMLAEVFGYETTRDYLKGHQHGPIIEWMTRFPDALEDMLHRVVSGS